MNSNMTLETLTQSELNIMRIVINKGRIILSREEARKATRLTEEGYLKLYKRFKARAEYHATNKGIRLYNKVHNNEFS
jgi:predicted transcriptional regulator